MQAGTVIEGAAFSEFQRLNFPAPPFILLSG
jgi:hypothetical protein